MQKQQNIVFTEQNLTGNVNTELSDYRVVYNPHSTQHTHDCAEFGICLSGNGFFQIGERVFPFFQNTVSYIPPHVPHIAQNPPGHPSQWIFLFADPNQFGTIAPPQEGGVIWEKDASELLLMIIKTRRDPHNDAAYYRALVDAFFSCIHAHQPSFLSNCDPYAFHKIAPTIQYITANFAEKFDISHLANLCQMSTSLFNQLFRKATGVTPMAYVHSLRIAESETLLLSHDLSITEIAYRIGYSSQSSFYRQFFKKHRMSPHEYRNLHCDYAHSI